MSVVIIDTGLDVDHPFFGADRDGNGIADRIVYQYDFADGDADASDTSGHGTHVSSIIASQDPAYPGIAPGVGIIHLKVFSNGGRGNFGHLEKALQWVIDQSAARNIAAVNLSLGDGQNWSQAVGLYGITDELDALDQLGVITVAAAGNSFASFGGAEGLAYPAADPNVISVGAVWDADRGRQDFGNLGIDHSTAADRIAGFSQRDRDLTLSTRLDLVRQLAEVMGYAHKKRVVHRALSPRSILVHDAASEKPRLKVFNWQSGYRWAATGPAGSSTGSAVTATAHVGMLVGVLVFSYAYANSGSRPTPRFFCF